MEAQRSPGVVVVLLNYNGLADTVECHRSLQAQDYPELTILIIDNGSTEPETGRLAELCPGANIVRLDRNHGFAGGCNLGMEWALERGADYIWLLNNDTVVRSDAVSVLVRAAESHPEFAFFGNLICLYDEPETIWFGGGDLNLLTGAWHHRGYGHPLTTLEDGGVEPTSIVSGCSILVHADTVRSVGVFDPRYFMYWEEIDWQLRARRSGRLSALVREVLVHHKVSRTTKRLGGELGSFLLARNCLLVARTHARSVRPLWALRAFLAMVVRPLLRGEVTRARAALDGLRHMDVPPERFVATLGGR